ncbi:MAG TPA: hypothetical protein VK136_04475 [Bacillota bacterium]|nr:hypothetical protein [Bacillota bacterium]
MKTRIAVFGRKDTVARIENYISEKEEIQIFPFIYQHVQETNDLIEKAVMCDIYLFMNPLAYLYAKDKIDKKRLPAIQIPIDEFTIATALYRLKNSHKYAIRRISIDTSQKQAVMNVLDELAINPKDIYLYNYDESKAFTPSAIASFHENLNLDGKTDFVLTSSRDVENLLQEKNIPVSTIQIPKTNVLKAIHEAKTTMQLNEKTSAQIVAGYVRIKNLGDIREEKNATYARKLVQTMQDILEKYGRKTHSSVLSIKDNLFVLFGTRGMLNYITNNYRNFPLLRELEKELDARIDIGLGLGLTAKQAEYHATLALEACATKNISNAYIVNEREDMFGPLGVEKPFDTSKLYHSLIHKAKLNNELSYNFLDFISLRNNEPFSAQDIAAYYGVTKRSAERTIGKLLSGKVIKVVGEEKPYLRGRPRKLFQIDQ